MHSKLHTFSIEGVNTFVIIMENRSIRRLVTNREEVPAEYGNAVLITSISRKSNDVSYLQENRNSHCQFQYMEEARMHYILGRTHISGIHLLLRLMHVIILGEGQSWCSYFKPIKSNPAEESSESNTPFSFMELYNTEEYDLDNSAVVIISQSEGKITSRHVGQFFQTHPKSCAHGMSNSESSWEYLHRRTYMKVDRIYDLQKANVDLLKSR